LKIRQATLEDFERINELNGISYGFDAVGAKERQFKRFEMTFKENYCIEVDGIIVANSRYIQFEQNIRGKLVKMGGIAMVASDPQYRRRGFVRELMIYLLKKMNEDKCLVSTLYPFRDTFYTAFGYVNGSTDLFLKVDPRFFNRWKKLPEGYKVERLSSIDGFKYYRSIHDKAMNNIHGGVKRSEDRWKEYDNPGPISYAVAFGPSGEAEGVIKYYSKGYGSGFSWTEEGKMDILDIYFLTPKARHALYNYLFLFTDQVVKVKYPLTPGESELYPWMQGYCMVDVDHSNIWMGRIIDIQNTIQNLPASKEGILRIKISDPDFIENNQTFEISSQNNKLKVKILGEKEADIEMTIQGLTSLVYGFLPSYDLEPFEWIKGATEKHLSLLDNWFPYKLPKLTEGF